MIVQCPYCATRYKIDDAKVAAGNARMKCSRCQQVFPAPSTKKRVAAAPTKPTLAGAVNLKLPFDDSPAKDNPVKDLPAKEPPAVKPASKVPVFDLGAAADSAEEDANDVLRGDDEPPAKHEPVVDEIDAETDADGANDDDKFEISEPPDTYTLGTEEVAPSPKPAPAPRRATPRPPSGGRGASAARGPRKGAAPPASSSERGKFRAIMVFQVITVVIYAALFQAMLASPAMTDDLLQKLPLISAFRNDKLMARKIALSELSGGYQRIKEGKEVFVVRGHVLNTAPVALQSVQIAGKLYDSKGKVVDTKTIFCGSVISTKVLKDLTTPELSMLQPPYPPKHFAIEPGESKSFVVVFTEPPRDAAEFTTQVVSAQRQS